MPDNQIKEGFEKTKDVLQELVVVVSLVRTLTEGFGSASDLYRKLKKKSKHAKKDIKDHIKEGLEDHLQEDVDEHRRKHGRSKSTGHLEDDKRAHHHHMHLGSRDRSKRRRDDSRDSDVESIDTSSPLVRAEYEHGYRIIGDKYAVGDLITRNQLQSQIIALQQTLLQIYDDLLEQPRHPPAFHLHRLLLTTRSARAAAIDALASQYKRMRPPQDDQEMHILPVPPGAFPPSPPRRLHEHYYAKPSRHLFCIYAHNLQHTPSLPLSDNFKPGGDNRCPSCNFHIPVLPTRAWEIMKHDERKTDVERIFLLGTRFVAKSHRDGGGYACVLCSKFRDADTVCNEVSALVDHIWKEHTCAELEQDGSIYEVCGR
ncbi:hypothetical protein CC80DRAFT_15332 [Byssothecium circinans]|uniref:Uncharacterized protein n=1 Tax=Byssothecium circinans TaxID=147558 RepID=A0A6A5U6K5_9PLEO|nr:hypothetical protein CC80DRAFT_15332 [Byssothecium circinans]